MNTRNTKSVVVIPKYKDLDQLRINVEKSFSKSILELNCEGSTYYHRRLLFEHKTYETIQQLYSILFFLDKKLIDNSSSFYSALLFFMDSLNMKKYYKIYAEMESKGARSICASFREGATVSHRPDISDTDIKVQLLKWAMCRILEDELIQDIAHLSSKKEVVKMIKKEIKFLADSRYSVQASKRIKNTVPVKSFEDYLVDQGFDPNKYRIYLDTFINRDAESLTVLAFGFGLENLTPKTKLYEAINFTFKTSHTRAGLEYHFNQYKGAGGDRERNIKAAKREIEKLT